MKIQFKFSVLLLLFLFAFQSQSYAATYTWTGNNSSAWNDPGNWSGPLPSFPNILDDVIIPSGRPNDLIIISAQFVRSMVVESGATVTINSIGTLFLNNATGDAIDNVGIISNAGNIAIPNAAARGIFNHSGATFTNDGTISIGTDNLSTVSNGIRNEGTNTDFLNNGTINIERANDTALRNGGGGNFSNANGAAINIGQNDGNITQNGILNIGNSASFNNSGTITIDNTGTTGVQNQSNFNNLANASLDIGQNTGNIGGVGISNTNITSPASFTNNGTINVDNTTTIGIQNRGNFNNVTNANLKIGQNGGVGQEGIQNLGATAILTNEGQIQIDSVGINGLSNEGTFNNENSGSIQIGLVASIDNIGILNTGIFSSTGDTIKITNTGAAGIENQDTLTNASVIVIENTGGRGINNNSGAVFTNDSTIDIGTNNLPTGGNGIRNAGTGTQFQNNNRINIERSDAAALQNQGGAQFTNAVGATLEIGQGSGSINNNGIRNLNSVTTFTNGGSITIDNTSSSGLSNDGDFNNATNAIIDIGQGIGNIGGVGIFNQATFTNSSIINVDNTFRGVTNRGQFDNTANAYINIGQNSGNIDSDGVFNTGSSAFFTNNGNITADNTSSNGVRNEATFENAINSTINIGQNDGNIGGNGIQNSDTTSNFTNEGVIQIDDVGSNGLVNESTFNSQNSGKLTIGLVASIDSIGILNTGTFSSTGDTIKISNTGEDGIDNQDTLMNAGVIVIDHVGRSGILNNFEGVFTNSGTTNIDNVSVDGVENQGIFNNAVNANINIGQHGGNIGDDGMVNFDSFTNNGTIVIDNVSDEGLLNFEDFIHATNANLNIGQNDGNIGSDGLRNFDSFTNNSTITIDNTSNIGIRNEGDFNNAVNADINIGQNDGNIGGNGISNSSSSSSFTNNGDIKIDNTSSSGIRNTTTFNNVTNATINIGQHDGNIGIDGILNTGTFSNTGDTIKISNTGADGINNQDTLTNAGVIIIENTTGKGIFNHSGATLTNNGVLNIGTNNLPTTDNGIRNAGINTSFLNNGTIHVEQRNTFDILSVDNSEFINAEDAVVNIGQNSITTSSTRLSNVNNSSFTNRGTINIDNIANNGLQNQGDFHNAINASLNIGQNSEKTGTNGISNIGTFTNHSTIRIDSISLRGIQNNGDFHNAVTANLNIGQNTQDKIAGGIGNASTFKNSSAINIDNVGTGIENTGDFSNAKDITINMGLNAGDGILNAGSFASFTNSGTITIDDPTASSNSGMFLSNNSQFIDSTGIIRLGQNHAFTMNAFIINVSALFMGNDSTTIQCTGNFFINSSGMVSGIGQLELEGDWVNNGTFSADSSLVTILGTAQSVIGGNSATTFFDLAINNSGNVVLERDVTVTRQLSLEAGQVNLGDNDFKLGDDFELFTQIGISALVTDGLGEIISTIANGTSQIFPAGNSNYTPITIQNDGTSDQFSVQCLPKVLSDGTIGNVFPNDVVSTTWLVEEALAGGTNATLTAQWTGGEELPDFNRFNAFLSRYDGTAWDSNAPTSASGTDPYTISRSGVTTFSPFAVGTFFIPDFSCVANSLELNDVALASGTYSTRQSIESTSLIEAGSTVDFIAANIIELKVGFHAENGSTFSARISNCLPPINNEEIIEERTEIAAQPITRTALLFPNPVGQHLNIRDGIGQAVVYNMLGQEIQVFEIRDDLHTLDVSSLQSGQYILLILRDNGERLTLSFMK